MTGTNALLLAVFGPTASGKSALAILLAQALDGEIVNCDSVQVYRGFDIGSAKLSPSERGGVPHHLIDIVPPQEPFSAGAFARQARLAIAAIAARGRLPILAGGTGFYVRALLDGLSPAPERDAALRQRLEAAARRRPGLLHRYLTCLDPVAASRIAPADSNKLIRAIEATRLSGQPISQLQAAPRDALEGFSVLKLFLDPPRDQLYQRINRRADWMFAHGLLEETARLLADTPRQAQPMLAVGYRQAVQVLDGELSVDAAVALTAQATRRYAKRQWTWFRRDPDLVRLPGFGDDPAIFEAAFSALGEWRKSVGERPLT